MSSSVSKKHALFEHNGLEWTLEFEIISIELFNKIKQSNQK